MQCARSAVRHLNKAWEIRYLDLGMALFRCLTAEEETATAIFLALKSRQYKGAQHLNHRSHRDKAAVAPFLRAVGNKLASMELAQKQPTLIFDARGLTPRLSVRITVEQNGEQRWIYPVPPLGFSLKLNDEADDVNTHINESKNLRNRILYASPQGVPSIEGDGESLVKEKRDYVFGILTIFLFIEQTSEKQISAQQCLTAFLKMLRKHPDEMPLSKSREHS